ncbi:FHA domain-containing protein FhaB/FipA [Buchananella felis]|uniref:FHA domain-containing protein FhaB/FipA n=1 Tax=Buchananella felis TaxID=3231492 RepID=UPI0035287318
MSELAFTLLRFGFLALLWVFIALIVGVLRRDLFGPTVRSRGAGRPAPTPPASVGQRTLSRLGRGGAGPVAAPSHDSPAAVAAPPLRLLVTQGPLAGTSIPLVGTSVVVGRSPSSTLVLDDGYASSRHARFYPGDGGWFVEDLGSTNGTLVDNEKIKAATPVGVGSSVRIGQTVIEPRR